MKAKKSWGRKTAVGSALCSRAILVNIGLSTVFALLALIVWSGKRSESISAAAPAAPTYQIALASFGPINADMFIADADGNNAKPLLPHAGFDGNGSFSLDGKSIVFTSERDGSYDIYRSRPDGSGLERLVDDPAYDDQAALSPDGRSMAFVSTRSGQADIWILALPTKKLRNLTAQPAGDFRPAWSPDGEWLAFSSDRDSRKPKPTFVLRHSTEIYLIRADGTGLRRVTEAQTFAGSPRWSADGKQLLFYEADIDEVAKITGVTRQRGITQIATIELATNERRVLTTGPARSGRHGSRRRIASPTPAAGPKVGSSLSMAQRVCGAGFGCRVGRRIGSAWCFTATSSMRGRRSSSGTAWIRSSASCVQASFRRTPLRVTGFCRTTRLRPDYRRTSWR